MLSFDLAVIGSGPAGSSAAKTAAQLGLRTVLLDKYRFPRHKTCGGGLTRACVRHLGSDLPSGIIKRECYNLTAIHKGNSIRIKTAKSLVTQIERQEFDYLLVQQASNQGAIVHDNICAKSIESKPNGVLIETNVDKYVCQIVIICDGSNGLISSSLCGHFAPSALGVCRVAHIPVSEVEGYYEKHDFEVIYGMIPTGYIWVFPKSDYLSVGIGGPWKEMKHGSEILKQWIAKRYPPLSSKVHSLRLKGGFIPRRQRNALPMPRIMLAGDAAGFVDPFLGEGIKYALISGRLAANQAAFSLGNGNPGSRDSLVPYLKECRQAFGNDLYDAQNVCRVFRHFSKPVFNLYFSSPEPFTRSIGILEGSISYRDLMVWLIGQIPGEISSAITKLYKNYTS